MARRTYAKPQRWPSSGKGLLSAQRQEPAYEMILPPKPGRIRKYLNNAVCAIALLSVALPAAAQAQNSPGPESRATPPAFPVFPFYADLSLLSGTPVSAGLPNRRLGVTNLTISNFNDAAVKIFVFLPVYAAGGVCGDPVLAGDPPTGYYMVGAQQTVAIPFPTPLVYKGKPSCIGATIVSGATSGVDLYVTGFGE
jgi:hypothetical protein